jgi:hypothetical protein
MGWSGRAPAQPAISWPGAPRQGARHGCDSTECDDAEIKRAIAQGIRKDGSHLKPPMGFEWYARMTDADLSAVVA